MTHRRCAHTLDVNHKDNVRAGGNSDRLLKQRTPLDCYQLTDTSARLALGWGHDGRSFDRITAAGQDSKRELPIYHNHQCIQTSTLKRDAGRSAKEHCIPDLLRRTARYILATGSQRISSNRFAAAILDRATASHLTRLHIHCATIHSSNITSTNTKETINMLDTGRRIMTVTIVILASQISN